jgi:ureidoglycolate dehydrogenase (NAD+)
VNLPAQRLQAWSLELLRAVGLSDEAARTVAESLVEANLRGIDSHGVLRLPIYLRRLEAGLVNKAAKPKVIKREGGFALVDADHGPGQVAGVFAVELAMRLAKDYGVGVVGVQRSSHYGAAAYYVMRAAREGFLALSTSHAEPDMVPYGGAKSALGTNPIAFAAKAPQGLFVLDMATSQVAMGKVFLARERGEPIPEGWAVDGEGHPTTDPHLARAAVPMAGPKGYALALMVEVLSGVFTGAGVAHTIGRMYDEWDKPQDVGHFFMVLDPDKGIGREAFEARLGGLWEALKSTPAAPGFDEVMIPGELEEKVRGVRLTSGVPLTDSVYDELVRTSRELGVEVPR